MPKPLQANVFLAAKFRGRRSLPRTVPVVFRTTEGGVGKRDHLTHWIHSYPAKMFHRIPQVILEQLPDQPKLTILDPFCGSGTVLLEALAKGHRALGIDVNPMARLISRVKCTPLDVLHLKRHYSGIIRRSKLDSQKSPADVTLDFWFKRTIRSPLEALHRSIRVIKHDNCRDFYALTLSSIVRKCSLADPSIPPPVKMNQARLRLANNRYRDNFNYAHSLRSPDVYKLFETAVRHNLGRMSQLCELQTLGTAELLHTDKHASDTGLDDNSVDLVITSPPYCGAQKYIRSVRLELLLLGYDPETIADADRRTLGTERILQSDYFSELKGNPRVQKLHKRIDRINPIRAIMFAQYVTYLDTFAFELSRILKSHGDAFVTFGTDRVAGIDVDFAAIFAQQAKQHGMQHLATLVDSIPSRGLMTARHSSASTIKDERVVWLRR